VGNIWFFGSSRIKVQIFFDDNSLAAMLAECIS
jgi:hypothetical protein